MSLSLSLSLSPHPQACSAGHLPAPSHSATPPPPPSPVRLCSRRGCTSPVHPLCSTGYCDSHCHSHRCPQHRPSVPQPIPPVGSSRPARPPLTCRASGCSSPPHTNCSVGFCSTHCTSRRCQRRSHPLAQPRCRRPGCLEPARPDCPVGFCKLHCTSPRCLVHDPLSLSGNGQGAARR